MAPKSLLKSGTRRKNPTRCEKVSEFLNCSLAAAPRRLLTPNSSTITFSGFPTLSKPLFLLCEIESEWQFLMKRAQLCVWRYLFCFKTLLQIDSGQKVWKLLPKVPKSIAHVVKNEVRVKSVFYQNLCSSLGFLIGIFKKICGFCSKKSS